MNAEKRGSFAVLSGAILGQALRVRSGRIPQPRSGDLGDRRVPAALNVPPSGFNFADCAQGA
jgi:hypothetical protein